MRNTGKCSSMKNSQATTKIEKLSPTAVPDSSKMGEHEIVEKIYTAVLEQRLPPNTKLSEAKLCESLGVGRMRIRRSLLLLANQGIVDLHSNRGAFIACPDRKESKDVFGARLALEPSIVRQVASIADETEFTALEKLIRLEQKSRVRGDRREAIRLSGEFHVQLASATGNAVLKRIIRELVTRTSLIVGMFGQPGAASCPEHEHLDILTALRAGEADKAAQLTRQHLEHIESGLDLSTANHQQLDLNAILGGN
jgi:DNA-binding GntR family transcriptional regulator